VELENTPLNGDELDFWHERRSDKPAYQLPTASSPVYMILTQPSLDANTNSDISAWSDNRQYKQLLMKLEKTADFRCISQQYGDSKIRIKSAGEFYLFTVDS